MEENTDSTTSVNNFKFRKIVYYVLGIIEAFLAFRLIFKLLGANAGNTFVSLIYSISGALLAPFSGIFRTAVSKGIETKSVLEPATIIAMIVYAVIAYAIVRLIEISGTHKEK
jgi:hypothetical protein